MASSKAATLFQLLQIGLLARQAARMRLELFKLRLRARARHAALAGVLGLCAGVLLLLALGLCLGAVVVALQAAGYSWTTALLLTASGCLVLSIVLGAWAASNLGTAIRDERKD